MADDDDASRYQANFARNKAYLKPGDHNYNTQLQPSTELAFRHWLQTNKVPFDPNASVTDYDMRGFYSALIQGDPRATESVNPNDHKVHRSDYWKTPYHESFSNESQWADPKTAPKWTPDDKLVLPDGTVVFDERAKNKGK
jgi:hypothetical protein